MKTNADKTKTMNHEELQRYLKVTNADRIRSMSNEELNRFLWWFKVNTTARFLQMGGAGTMNAVEQKEWLDSDAPWEHTEFEQEGLDAPNEY